MSPTHSPNRPEAAVSRIAGTIAIHAPYGISFRIKLHLTQHETTFATVCPTVLSMRSIDLCKSASPQYVHGAAMSLFTISRVKLFSLPFFLSEPLESFRMYIPLFAGFARARLA